MSESERPDQQRRNPRRRRRSRRPAGQGGGTDASTVVSGSTTPAKGNSPQNSTTQSSGSQSSGSTGSQPRPARRRRGGRRRGGGQGSANSAAAKSGTTTSGSTSRSTSPSSGKTGHSQPAKHVHNQPGKQAHGQPQKQGQKQAKQGAAKRNLNKQNAAKQAGSGNRNPARGNNRRRDRNSRSADRHSRRMRTVVETSAGGLVLRGLIDITTDTQIDRLEVALIGRLDRRGRMLWSMPKGHIEPGETFAETARREVAEETGLSGTVLATLGEIDYWFVADGRRIHKTVHHHLIRFDDGELCDEDPEITEVAWVPFAELPTRLAYPDERKLVEKARTMISSLAAAEREGRNPKPLPIHEVDPSRRKPPPQPRTKHEETKHGETGS